MSGDNIELIFLCDLSSEIFSYIPSALSITPSCSVLQRGLLYTDEIAEHELGIIGRKIYWRKGVDLINRPPTMYFSLDSLVQDALICRFPKYFEEYNAMSCLSCLCVVESTRITAFSEDDIFNISLPFPLKSIWKSRYGLILQRDPFQSENLLFQSIAPRNKSMNHQSSLSSELPILFILTHPLNEPSQLVYKYSNSPRSIISNFCNPLIDVIHVADNPCFVILYDNTLKQHSIWFMMPASQKKKSSYLEADDLIHVDQPMSSSAPPRVQHFEVTPFNSPLKLYTPSPSSYSMNLSNYPDCISTPFLSGGSLRSVPLVEVSLSRKFDLRVATVKRNLSQIVSDFTSGCDSKSNFCKIPGYKQFMAIDKQHSRLGPGISSIKRAKSLSPNSVAFPSPLSRSTIPNAQNTRLAGVDDHVEPEICLLNIYTQSSNLNGFKASKAFQYTDIFNKDYVVFVDRVLCQVWILELFYKEPESNFEFGNSFFIDARDAVSVDSLHFLLCLNKDNYSLHIYSCHTHICQVFINSPQKPYYLCDSIKDRVTISFLDGSSKRYKIPGLSRNNTAALMISSFLRILPQQIFLNFVNLAYLTVINDHLLYFSTFLNVINNFFGVKEDYFFQDIFTRSNLLSILSANRASNLPSMKCLAFSNLTQFDPFESFLPILTFREYLSQTFVSMHLIFEEIMISPFTKAEVMVLSRFLSQFVVLFDLPIEYLEYYHQLVPSITSLTHRSIIQPIAHSFSGNSSLRHVNSLFIWLTHQCIFPLSDPVPFPYIPNITTKTVFVICINILLLFHARKPHRQDLELYLKNISTFPNSLQIHSCLIRDFNSLFKLATSQDMVITFLINHDINTQFLMNFASAYSIPITDFLESCKLDPPKHLPGIFYLLIDRIDIASHEKCSPSSYTLNSHDSKTLSNKCSEIALFNLLFPDDNRINEVIELLDSSQNILIDVEQSQDLSDEDYLELQSTCLLKLSIRSIAIPIGRGMLNFGRSIALDTDVISIPELNISGKALHTNSTISIDGLDKPHNFTFWPEFHNGVAAGLILDPFNQPVDSGWMLFNRPIYNNQNEYAGFLMAMGLLGHLASLSKFTMHDFLIRGHELTLVGVLIGISAAKRTSMDQDITRMLSIYIRSLQPESSMEIEISPNVQTAAILALGMLYQGTLNRHIVDVLLGEIVRSSSCKMENIFDRRCRCLSSGFALGLTLLGAAMQGEAYPLKGITEKLINNITGDFGSCSLNSPVRSQQISDEGIDIMSLRPASLMALAMIYLKSGDQSISNFLKPENSYFLLDETHPHILLLQTISYCLVQWHSIQPTQEWLDSIIPRVLVNNITKSKKDLIQDGMQLDALQVIYSHILVGCLFSLGLRFAGSHSKIVYEFIFSFLVDHVQHRLLSEFASLTRINCSLLACSLVMCGTGDTNLLKMIYQLRAISKGDNDLMIDYGNHMVYHMALGMICLGKFKYCLRTNNESIAYLLISMYPIFPNSSSRDIYHLQAFRHLYALALEKRFLFVKDLFANEPCEVNATIHYSCWGISCSQEITLPYLVPETHDLTSIVIHSDDHWPIQIHNNLGHFSELYSKGGQLYLLKRHFFWEIFPIGVLRTLLFDFYRFILNSIIVKFYPIVTRSFLSHIYTPENISSIYIIGQNNLTFDKIICILSYIDCLSKNLLIITWTSQQFVLLYYFYHFGDYGSFNLYMQELIECSERKFQLTLKKMIKYLPKTEHHFSKLEVDIIKMHTLWYHHLK